MNEWMNKGMNKQANEGTKETKNERTNEYFRDWILTSWLALANQTTVSSVMYYCR